MRVFLFIFLFHSSVISAANTSFEAFDFNKCQRWHITDDSNDNSPAYAKAAQVLKKQPLPLHSYSYQNGSDIATGDSYTAIFSASTFADKEQSRYVNKFGVCTYSTERRRSSQFKCLPNQDFPFSGATYIEAKGRKVLPPMKCASGCRSTRPPLIYSMNMEEGESDASRAWKRIYERFQTICGKSW